MKETMYQRLMRMSELCAEKALKYYSEKDIDLCIFFHNASEGLKAKAYGLEVGQ